MRFPPLSVIATWPRPNYIDPPTRGPALIVTELTTLLVALICLALRLWIRVRQLHKAWWDDWVMVVAGICCAGTTLDVILATQLYGWDRHVWDVPYWMLVQGRKVSAAGQAFFVFASGLGKLSILLSYLRIALPGTLFRRLTWGAVAFNVLTMIVFFVLLWAQCSPPSSYWNLDRTEQDCISEVPGIMSQAVVTVLTDFIVFVLPMPTLYRLSLPMRQRVGLMILFGLGGVVVVAGCMRTYWVHRVEVETYDVTWEGWELWIWAAVEANLGVICGCAPILRSLVSDGGSKYLRTQAVQGDSSSGAGGRSTTNTKNSGLLGWTGGRKKKRGGAGGGAGGGSTTRGSTTSGMVGGKPYFEMVRMEAGTERNSVAPSDRPGSQRHLYRPQDDNSLESLHLPRQGHEEQVAGNLNSPQLADYPASLRSGFEYEAVGPESPQMLRHSESWPLGPLPFERRGSWRM
ncbi:ATP dependent DNA ligase domain-containing protein [Apiospora arundinis]